MENNINPRVLVMSNDCISNSTSNGRTMRNFLVGYDKNKIAQFCIHNVNPDFSVCNNYFCISDQEALNCFLNRKNKTENIAESNKSAKNKTSIKAFIRNIVWKSNKWKKNGFIKWLNDFKPEVVLLQAGDCGFMYKLSRNIAKEYKASLVIYNSEDYYFKKYDYFKGGFFSKLFYPIYRFFFCNEFRKTIKKAYKSIYICKPLQDLYDIKFSLPSETVYTGTEMTECIEPSLNSFVLSYVGNLGVGRDESLLCISEVLQEIDKNLKINVYGKFPNEKVKMNLENRMGIEYKGFIDYNKIKDVYENSNVIIHVESFEPFYVKDIKYGFTTKVADVLATGKCFLAYVPKNSALDIYLKENSAAFVANSKEELKLVLTKLYNDPIFRNKNRENALKLVNVNHNAGKNAERFQSILRESVK